MNDVKWSKTEKMIAKRAFEGAHRKECEATLQELKEKVASAKEASSLWHIQHFLLGKLHEIERKYDYRYSVLLFVFARLLKEGWIQESDIEGLTEDKLEKVKYLANPERSWKCTEIDAPWERQKGT
jgi:hypothetical protein